MFTYVFAFHNHQEVVVASELAILKNISSAMAMAATVSTATQCVRSYSPDRHADNGHHRSSHDGRIETLYHVDDMYDTEDTDGRPTHLTFPSCQVTARFLLLGHPCTLGISLPRLPTGASTVDSGQPGGLRGRACR